MMQLVGFGAPLFEVFARFIVWLYMPALLFFLIGYRMLTDSIVVLVARQDLLARDRFQLGLRHAVGALQGFVVGTLVFLAIYHRKELFKCVASLF